MTGPEIGLICFAAFCALLVLMPDRAFYRLRLWWARYHPGMTPSLEFEVAKRRREPINFHLNDEPDFEYTYIPQKIAGIALAVADNDEQRTMKHTFDWLSDGLPDEQAQHLVDRLEDPEDDLDVEQLGAIIEKLQEQITGRPTTPEGGSRAQRRKAGRSSTAGARAKA